MLLEVAPLLLEVSKLNSNDVYAHLDAKLII